MAELIDEKVRNSATIRPDARLSGASRRWFKKADAVAGTPGTIWDETFVNDLLGNLYHILDQGGVVHTLGPGGDGDLLTAIANVLGSPTGSVRFGIFAVAPAGWLLYDDGTLGPAGSGATHAGPQYEALFKHIWNNRDNTRAPVSGGRGSSAQADWDDGSKTIQLPALVDRVLGVAGGGSRAGGDTDGADSQPLAAHTHDQQTSARQLGAGVQTNVEGSVTAGVTAPAPGQNVVQRSAYTEAIIKL